MHINMSSIYLDEQMCTWNTPNRMTTLKWRQAAHTDTLTLPCLMTLLTASDTICEWNSRLQHNTVKLEKWLQQSSTWQEPKADQDSAKKRNGVYSLEMPEHVSSTQQHGCWVGNIPSHSLCKRVACTLKKRWDSRKKTKMLFIFTFWMWTALLKKKKQKNSQVCNLMSSTTT